MSGYPFSLSMTKIYFRFLSSVSGETLPLLSAPLPLPPPSPTVFKKVILLLLNATRVRGERLVLWTEDVSEQTEPQRLQWPVRLLSSGSMT